MYQSHLKFAKREMIIRQEEGASQRGKGVNVRVGGREGSALGKRGSDLNHTYYKEEKKGIR